MAYLYAVLFLAAFFLPGGVTGLASTELALTNRRLLGKTGIFRRKSCALRHQDIAVVNIRQSLLGQLCDYGTVTIIGGDGRKIKFKGIAEPFDMQMQAEEAVEKAFLGRVLSQTEQENRDHKKSPPRTGGFLT